MNRRTLIKLGLATGSGWLVTTYGPSQASSSSGAFEVTKSESEWRELLTPLQYQVLRQEATEPPYKNLYWDHKEAGIYACAGCDKHLFSSETKFDSKTGWPSFWEPIVADAVGTKIDRKLIFARTEVHCARCGGHLGHVFEDGPPPTGLRYCVNSAALTFIPAAGA